MGKRLLIIGVILVLKLPSFSQNISDIISDTSLNYFQIIEIIENNKSTLLDSEETGIQKRYNRWLTFWDSRVDENGEFYTYGYEIENYSKNKAKSKTLSFVWENLGPFENNLLSNWKHIGRVQSIWVNPADTSEILVGTDNAGLWGSINGGLSWELLTPNLSFGIYDIEVDTDSNIIYRITLNLTPKIKIYIFEPKLKQWKNLQEQILFLLQNISKQTKFVENT